MRYTNCRNCGRQITYNIDSGVWVHTETVRQACSRRGVDKAEPQRQYNRDELLNEVLTETATKPEITVEIFPTHPRDSKGAMTNTIRFLNRNGLV